MERKPARSFFKIPFLKSSGLFSNNGFTLMETLIVVALIAVLAGAFLASANYMTQIQKGKDAKRKSDLAVLKSKMEDYYNDHSQYPTLGEMDECNVALTPYLNFIPCDPGGDPYTYETDATRQWYRIYTNLANKKDPDITALGCSSGCGSSGQYNYGISSSNVGLEVGGGTGTGWPPCSGGTATTCGNPENFCGEVGPCCPGSSYRVTCQSGQYWCCPI